MIRLVLISLVLVSQVALGKVSRDDLNLLSQQFIEVIGKRKELQSYSLQIEFLEGRTSINATFHYRKPNINLLFYQGLLDHEDLKPSVFLSVACHELGHIIGGAPKYDLAWNSYVGYEGQSDYFVSLKCLRWLLEDSFFQKYLLQYQTQSQDPFVIQQCQEQFKSEDQIKVCRMSAQAGLEFIQFFENVKEEDFYSSFGTPDSLVAGGTYGIHPDFQCRLDTFLAGALCRQGHDREVSDMDPFQGTCKEGPGARPQCWFIKSEFENSP